MTDRRAHYAARLADVLEEMGFVSDSGLELARVAAIIRRETDPHWPETRLKTLLSGAREMRLADAEAIAQALRFDVRLLVWADEDIPRHARRRPESVWERLPRPN